MPSAAVLERPKAAKVGLARVVRLVPPRLPEPLIACELTAQPCSYMLTWNIKLSAMLANLLTFLQ
jgi:hypothetical protein